MGGGFSSPSGIGAGHLGLGAIVVLGLIGWALGIDPRLLIGGAEMVQGARQGGPNAQYAPAPQSQGTTGVPKDQIGQFVAAILAQTEDVWSQVLPAQKGIQYERPKLVMYSGSPAQAAAGRRLRWGLSIVRSTRRFISTPPSSVTCRRNMAAAVISLMPM